MSENSEELTLLHLTLEQRNLLPLSFHLIYTKRLPPLSVERKYFYHSELFESHEFASVFSEKPISKIFKIRRAGETS